MWWWGICLGCHWYSPLWQQRVVNASTPIGGKPRWTLAAWVWNTCLCRKSRPIVTFILWEGKAVWALSLFSCFYLTCHPATIVITIASTCSFTCTGRHQPTPWNMTICTGQTQKPWWMFPHWYPESLALDELPKECGLECGGMKLWEKPGDLVLRNKS